MKYLSRVVWSEGMYLAPHHFQVQSRYFEDSIRFTTSSLWYQSYGLIGGQLDAAGAGQRHGLAAARPRHFPGRADVPHAGIRSASAGPQHRRSVSRRARQGHGHARRSAAAAGRLELHHRRTRTRAIATAKRRASTPNRSCFTTRPPAAMKSRFRSAARISSILLDTEPADDLITLPIARVMRDGSGHFVYDPASSRPASKSAPANA